MERRPPKEPRPPKPQPMPKQPPRPPKEEPKPKKHDPVIHDLIEQYAKENGISYKDAEGKIGHLNNEQIKDMLEHKK